MGPTFKNRKTKNEENCNKENGVREKKISSCAKIGSIGNRKSYWEIVSHKDTRESDRRETGRRKPMHERKGKSLAGESRGGRYKLRTKKKKFKVYVEVCDSEEKGLDWTLPRKQKEIYQSRKKGLKKGEPVNLGVVGFRKDLGLSHHLGLNGRTTPEQKKEKGGKRKQREISVSAVKWEMQVPLKERI